MLAERLTAHLATHDVIVLTGGVSMGRYDHVPNVLRQLGVREVLHKVAQRPGKPIWFGIGSTGQTVFGLPGNPVSALVCLLRYVVPALAAMAGAPARVTEHIPLGSAFKVKPALACFLPVRCGIQFDPGHGRHAAAHAWFGRFHFIAGYGWFRGTAAGPPRISGRFPCAAVPLVNAHA